MNNWTAAGAVALMLAVALGAFGAHALRAKLEPHALGIWEKAVFYHFVHALGLLTIPLLARVQAMPVESAGRICLLLLAGIVLFSGSLYLLAITGIRSLGVITPFGGVAFLCAWILLAWHFVRAGS